MVCCILICDVTACKVGGTGLLHRHHLGSANTDWTGGHQHFTHSNEGIENALHSGVEVTEAEVAHIVGPIVLIAIESDG